MNGEEVCCNRFYNEIGNKSGKIEILNELDKITNGQIIEFVEQEDNECLPSYNEMMNIP